MNRRALLAGLAAAPLALQAAASEAAAGPIAYALGFVVTDRFDGPDRVFRSVERIGMVDLTAEYRREGLDVAPHWVRRDQFPGVPTWNAS